MELELEYRQSMTGNEKTQKQKWEKEDNEQWSEWVSEREREREREEEETRGEREER